jgi:undecaprenyl phosphate-alpha-L-ara4N flippase subunit ArnE
VAYSRLYLVLGSLLGASGQIFLKLGASGVTTPIGYANIRILLGLTCYALGTAFWLLALARLPLSKVYPFTILTFVLVYLASIYLLGERISVAMAAGVVLVLVGLAVIVVC